MIHPTLYYIIAFALTFAILVGIYLMSNPKSASRGNTIGMYAFAGAIIVTLINFNGFTSPAILIAMGLGAGVGWWIAKEVKMIQMPQLVAFLNGLGGASAAIVAINMLITAGSPDIFSQSTAALALIIGMITLSGSWIAAAKLHQLMPQKPVVLPAHAFISQALVVGMVASLAFATFAPEYGLLSSFLLFVLSTAFGIILTIRVGGADMPITISLLISFSGLAGAIAGLALRDVMLVAIGGTVGASGLILTQIMCRAMNRALSDILFAKSAPKTGTSVTPAAKAASATPVASSAQKANDLGTIMSTAKRIIIIPGYGMALAQAQHNVKSLAETLQKKGAHVEYAIHPVAGRMPGHMNVLLAEAGVDYEQLKEMDEVNPAFKETDLVIVVGANDVVNPAAIHAEGTPIYGMPILRADEAKHVVICNFDTKPGYAGVENPLYTSDSVTMMLGDANKTVSTLITMAETGANSSAGASAQSGDDVLAQVLATAKKVIIVPGYGMALAQAQHNVKTLAEAFEAKGAMVDYAIHPVAGRMPGHMNVLLAEAGVDYEKLREMDEVNPAFKETDVVIVVGANDVVNPAAIHAEGTPIYGMPILRADEAKHVVICNFDTKPGYAGVENPLYTSDSVTMMLGDANKTVSSLITMIATGANSSAGASTQSEDDALAQVLATAKKVIIVPGYGMALAQAQHNVKSLAEAFEAKGATVDYAIHPVAGRMPGHMNVLLAEAGVDYEQLKEMDEVNPAFKETDVVIVVGANDVVNPAAIHAEGTPIYGMPILRADEAKHVVICNYDTKPGYAGVENTLYAGDSVTMMLGDANKTVANLISMVESNCSCATKTTGSSTTPGNDLSAAGSLLKNVKKVIIVPGYGMALAQAQHNVKSLADALEAKGATVDYAIHPVAGRMPGHMNVLLAEAGVDYEKLREMDEVNPAFKETDLVIVVGANDVVNPAAIEAEGTPIYGMPILRADEAKHVIICNYDTKPGYAGVENPLYTKDSVVLLLGDAAQTVEQLIRLV